MSLLAFANLSGMLSSQFPSISPYLAASPIIAFVLMLVGFYQAFRAQSVAPDYTDQMFEHTYPILTSIRDQATYVSDKAKSSSSQDLKKLVRWLDGNRHVGYMELEVAGKELDAHFTKFAENVRNLAALFEQIYQRKPEYIGHNFMGVQAFEKLARFLANPSLADLKEFNQAAGTPALPRIPSAEKSVIATLRKRSYILDALAFGVSAVAAIVLYWLATYSLGIQKEIGFSGALGIFGTFTGVYFFALRPRKETPARYS